MVLTTITAPTTIAADADKRNFSIITNSPKYGDLSQTSPLIQAKLHIALLRGRYAMKPNDIKPKAAKPQISFAPA
jgi:hypothetical protein